MGDHQPDKRSPPGLRSALRSDDPAWHGRSARFFGRRKGRRLRPARRELLTRLLPRLQVIVPAHRRAFDPRSLFDAGTTEIWMEIGFGSGEHLVAQAAAHPDVGFIGCEPYVNGVAALLAKLEDRHLSNVRVYANDARDLLAAVAAESLGRVFALYPDPWPKRKHHLRRLVSPPTLDLLARALRPRGELRLASDHMEYVRWMLNLTTSDPRFRWLARRPCDWRTRPADGFETRYEQKAALKGSVSVYLRFERLSGSVAGAVLEKTLCALGVGLYTEMMSRAV